MWQLRQSVSVTQLKALFASEQNVSDGTSARPGTQPYYFDQYLNEFGICGENSAEFLFDLEAVHKRIDEAFADLSRQDRNSIKSAVRRFRDTLLKCATPIPRTEFKGFADAFHYFGEIAMVERWLGTHSAGNFAGSPVRPNVQFMVKITGLNYRAAGNLVAGLPVTLDERWRAGIKRLEDVCHAPSGTFSSLIHFTSAAPAIPITKRRKRETYSASEDDLSPEAQDELRRYAA